MREVTDGVQGRLVGDDGDPWYRIDGLERMEPFLTTVVSDSDLWMFVSSAGPLTAGRVDADGALLPYETDDRLHRAVGVSGPITLIVRGAGDGREVWQPFARRPDGGCRRALEKRVLGNALTLEERNEHWGLSFRATWSPSRAYGWVRTVELIDDAGQGAQLEVLDGLLDVMPSGVDAQTERRASNLVDAFKRSETGAWGTLAIYALESRITDRAEPAETLAATAIWAAGLDAAEVHLDERVVDAVLDGVVREPVALFTGRRGAYLLRAPVEVPAAGSTSWMIVADGPLGHAALLDRVSLATDREARKLVVADIDAGTSHLRELLAGADAFQRTADPVADAHHLSNVLFNTMRGGTFVDGYRLPMGDLLDHLRDRNRAVHDRWASALADLGPVADLDAVTRAAEERDDPDLLRLVLEYLPLTFSRRHGDPSRPWNRFSIKVTADDGTDLLSYEGNWRDIFQNWEALLRSYPRYLPSVVAKFLNASTADGHNPYRISRDGIDWEVEDPDDPWSNIGYWGDHQIVYLLRLLEGWEAVAPGAIAGWFDRALFTYADVPYRIADHADLVRDPRSSITYDRERADRAAARVEQIGSDGRLVAVDGDIVHVTMAEKLLVPALAKLANYVAGGGIWMNTQRPEWNDGNNALAGYGLSMVTLYQLERYVGFLAGTLAGRDEPLSVSRAVADWLAVTTTALDEHDPDAAVADPIGRRALLDALGQGGAAHRERVYAGFDPTTVEVAVADVQRLFARALDHLRASIRAARRPDDGLYHAYNLVAFPTADEAIVRHLPPMLEGQVAVLGSTGLDASEVVTLVDRLFASTLYRADQHTFLLYPVPERASFPTRNTIPPEVVAANPVLDRLAADGPGPLIERDAAGGLHFRADLVNAAVLSRALATTAVDAADHAAVLAVYEQLFEQASFTGRSSGMHGYEGIGSIYWHMVSKLLLAVHDRYVEAEADGGAPEVLEPLATAYRRIRDGLGFRKGPAEFGAIPVDCYSHTPAHAGAQQPGMTGQVKEEVLTRAGELGLRFAEGTLSLGHPLLPPSELWTSVDGISPAFELTLCGVPVRVEQGEGHQVRIVRPDGTVTARDGRSLTVDEAVEVFDRRGSIARIEFATASPPGADARTRE